MANNVRTGGPGTAGATANFTVLREQSRRELTECIDRVRGPKALVLDPSLSGPLGLIAEKQLLKDHGIEKTYHLRSEPLETDQRRMVFLVRDSILNMKAVAAQVKYNQQRREKVGTEMLFVSRLSSHVAFFGSVPPCVFSRAALFRWRDEGNTGEAGQLATRSAARVIRLRLLFLLL
jgi:hypothetical protein